MLFASVRQGIKSTFPEMPILFVFAGLIAYSRVYLGVHYPIDILCGALAGTFIGSLVYSLVNKRATTYLPTY